MGCSILDNQERMPGTGAKMTRLTIDELEMLNPEQLGGLLYLVIGQPYPNFQYIQDILYVGCPIDGRDGAGCTPLHMASKLRKLDIMEYLISVGADVNAKDNMGWTAFHKAAADGHKEVIDFLISNGGDVDTLNIVGWTPLHDAARDGELDIVKFLVSKGADVNMRTEEYHLTPLHLASDSGHIPMMRFLIRYGADIHARDYEDRTPYDIANISIPNWNSFRAVIPELEPKYPHTF